MDGLNEYRGKRLICLFEYLLKKEPFDIDLMIMVYANFRNKNRNLSCSPWYKAFYILSKDVTDSRIVELTYAHNVKVTMYY